MDFIEGKNIMSELLTWLSTNPIAFLTIFGVILLISVIFIIAFFQGREISFWPPKIGAKPVRKTITVEPVSIESSALSFMKDGYPRSQHPEFFAQVEKLVLKAKKITLIATGLNLIWEKHILDLLLERAQAGEAEVIICLGNPYSPHVENRLTEEEMCDNRPPVGREGIIKNISALVDRLDRAGNPTDFSLLVFEHYPTFATLIFDKEIFIYPYAYQVLGNLSPIFHLYDDGGEEVRFFRANVDRIIHDATPAMDIVMRKRREDYVSDSWIGAAVYIIPRQNEALYNFGAAILGYDIWNNRFVDAGKLSGFRQYVGAAEQYGFHATLADALLFSTEAQIERIEAELRILASDFKPFTLSGFNIKDGIDERGDIVLLCEDKSGVTEAIHHELVTRVYRLAISSNYLSGYGRTKLYSESQRDALILRRYGAPFILSRFQIHFTLLSNSPKDYSVKSKMIEDLHKVVEDYEFDPTVIDEIVLVFKTKDSKNWSIRERFSLSEK